MMLEQIIQHSRRALEHKALIASKTLMFSAKIMCEFNVLLNGKSVFKDVFYAKNENGNVTLKNVLGETKEIPNCIITEVDVNAAKLVLTATKP